MNSKLQTSNSGHTLLYNGATGEIDLDFTSANTTVIGKATVTNVVARDGPLLGSEFLTPADNVGDGDFSEIGSLVYSFTDVVEATTFGSFLKSKVGGVAAGGKVSASATITFLNKIYGIANDPNPNDVTFKANTFDGSTYMSLWGADGDHSDPENNGVGGFSGSNIGTDVTFKLDMAMEVITVPEPSTLLLLGTGLVGLVGYRRRKRRA